MPGIDANVVDREETLTGAEQGHPAAPRLLLDGFSGPLDHLLALARAQKVDLSGIPLAELVDQLLMALRQARASTPLGQQGEWVVMATWLLQLRSLLLLPADVTTQQAAAAETQQLQERLVMLEAMQALAGWLARQPQLGHDVFGCGQPEVLGIAVEAAPAPDVIEFLWASLALFDDAPVADTGMVYRPVPLDLHTVTEARVRIMQRLDAVPGEASLDTFLLDWEDRTSPTARSSLRQRSAWSSMLVASLELARQDDLMLRQEDSFQMIHIAPVSTVRA